MGRKARLPGRGSRGKRGANGSAGDAASGGPLGAPRVPGPLYSAFHHSSQIDVRTRSTAKGLVNLGNTCFFNAVLQCISRAVPLRDAMKRLRRPTVRIVPAPRFLAQADTETSVSPAPIDVELLPPEGEITGLFGDFLTAVHGHEANVNPRPLFSAVCHTIPQFRGYQQQDSQELLRALLDCLDEEDKTRISASVLQHAGIEPDDVSEASAVRACLRTLTDDTRRRVRMYIDSCPTYVENVFGGRMASTITCSHCQAVSRTVEPFLDLSMSLGPLDKGRSGLTLRGGKGSSAAARTTRSRKPLQLTTFESTSAVAVEQAGKQGGKRRGQKDKAGKKTAKVAPAASSRTASTAPTPSATPPLVESAESDGSYGFDTVPPNENEADLLAAVASELDRLPVGNHTAEAEGATDTESLGGGGSVSETELDPSFSSERPATTCSAPATLSKPPVEVGSLVDPYVPRPGESSLASCLAYFTREEVLDGDDMFLCERCGQEAAEEAGRRAADSSEEAADEVAKPPAAVRRPAVKQIQIDSPPRVLTMHLKRFEQSGRMLQKLSKTVKFPTVLELAPFCTADTPISVYTDGDTGIRYGLFAVIEHQGNMRSGHYVAYVKDLPDPSATTSGMVDAALPGRPRWWYVSDTRIREVSEQEVLKSQAYVLFYERLH